MKIQSECCLTDEDWAILGVLPGEAYKTGYHQGFYEAWRLITKESNGKKGRGNNKAFLSEAERRK